MLFSGGKRRKDKDIINRLPLLHLAIPVIKSCTSVKETRESEEIINGKKVTVSYFALESYVGRSNTRVRVVIRKVGKKGNYNFYSIMRYK